MKVVYTDRFQTRLVREFEYGIERFGRIVAERTYNRVISQIERFLVGHPRTGAYVADIDAFHGWIPGTSFVVFYRVDPQSDTLTVLALLHQSQDRDDLELG